MSDLSKPFRIVVLIVSVIAAGGVYAQQIEGEFGWSLKVDPANRKSAEARSRREPRTASAPEEIRVETDLVLSDLLLQDRWLSGHWANGRGL